MKTLIIDDEQSARTTLKTFLTQYCPALEIVGEADGIQTGRASIANNQPDLLFLDISMQDGTGFDLLSQIPNPSFHVVFITAHDEYAIKAFEYNAIDYLLKPLHPDQLVRVVKKAKAHSDQQGISQQLTQLLQQIKAPTEAKRISLATQEGMLVLDFDEIGHLQSDGSYTSVYFGNCEKVMVSKLIKDFEQILPNQSFFRIHQSHIINIHYIRKILKEDGGMVLLKNGKKVPIARRKKEGLQQLLAQEMITF